MTRIGLEVCVDDVASLEAAIMGGADRIELCAALSEGGLTPSPGFMQVAAATPVAVYAMIRPRGGDFAYSTREEAIMAADIMAAQNAGLDGVVFGAALGDALDTEMLRRLRNVAPDFPATLHRVVDGIVDPLQAVDQAIALGFERILTSGGAPTAKEGTEVIAQMVARAGPRLSIMPGAGVTANNAKSIIAATHAREIHGSFSVDTASGLRQTALAEVQAAVEALKQT